jgi:hypothetical protein
MRFVDSLQRATKIMGTITLFTCAVFLCGRAEGKPTLLIYYANETVPESLSSNNNRALFAALAHQDGHFADTVRSSVQFDAEHFEASVDADVATLVADAKSRGFDLAVFTNELALAHHFIFVKNGIGSTTYFDGLEGSTSSALLFSPLAVPKNLRAALQLALGQEQYGSFAFILNSHGTKNFAAVPRIAADFLSLPLARLASLLIDTMDQDPIKSLIISGLTKDDFWDILGEVSRYSKTRISIVVNESCDSGPYTWKHYNLMRSADTLIAHRGFGFAAPGDLNLTALNKAWQKHDKTLEEGLLVLTRAAGYWDNESVPLYVWPSLALLMATPKVLYFGPLIVWLAMLPWRYSFRMLGFGLRRLRATEANRSSL